MSILSIWTGRTQGTKRFPLRNMKRTLTQLRNVSPGDARRIAQTQIQTNSIRFITLLVAILAYTGVAMADPGTGTMFTPMQGEELCGTDAGGLIESGMGLLILVFVGGIVAAIFIAGAIEANPLSGWWNQMGYSMMGKIPVAVVFVVVMLSFFSVALSTAGIGVPPCIPILG